MNPKQFEEFIDRVLEDLGSSYCSNSATQLLLLTAATESGFGRWIRQIKGPACGIFQIEPNTEILVWKWCLENNQTLFKALVNSSSGDLFGKTDLIGNMRYQVILARANYYSWPHSLPEVSNPIKENEIETLAAYWKRYWNTYAGDGNVPQAVENYKKYVLG